MNIVDYAKDNPIKTGAIVVIGGIIFLVIVNGGRSNSGPQGVIIAGPSEQQVQASAAVEAARLQTQLGIYQADAAVRAVQIGAGVQLNSDDRAAEVAMRNIEALEVVGLRRAEVEGQSLANLFTLQNRELDISQAQIDAVRARDQNFWNSLAGLKKKDRDDTIETYVTGTHRPSSGGGGIGSILGGIGSIVGSVLPFFSDERLKENIAHVGWDENGRDVYEFNYRGSATRRRGYIAQSLARSEPDKVSVDNNTGYLRLG